MPFAELEVDSKMTSSKEVREGASGERKHERKGGMLPITNHVKLMRVPDRAKNQQ